MPVIMAESIKFNDNKFVDATDVWDSTANKSQRDINNNLLTPVPRTFTVLSSAFTTIVDPVIYTVGKFLVCQGWISTTRDIANGESLFSINGITMYKQAIGTWFYDGGLFRCGGLKITPNTNTVVSWGMIPQSQNLPFCIIGIIN